MKYLHVTTYTDELVLERHNNYERVLKYMMYTNVRLSVRDDVYCE
jgi:hypothetical protein